MTTPTDFLSSTTFELPGYQVERLTAHLPYGLEVEPGDHLCGLYAGVRERDELIVPFLRAGLRAGNKCICVVDGTEPAELVAKIKKASFEAIFVADDKGLHVTPVAPGETSQDLQLVILALLAERPAHDPIVLARANRPTHCRRRGDPAGVPPGGLDRCARERRWA